MTLLTQETRVDTSLDDVAGNVCCGPTVEVADVGVDGAEHQRVARGAPGLEHRLVRAHLLQLGPGRKLVQNITAWHFTLLASA